MGDVDEGDAEFALHPLQLQPHPHPQLLVERRQRLVEQQHPRLGDGGARQRHPLLLAAGELRRQRSASSVSRTFSIIASVCR